MPSILLRVLFIISLAFFCEIAVAGGCATCENGQCQTDGCCEKMGGINYCDSSVGFYVCNNGYFSSCYCTRHAIMDLQQLQGCCMWNGGVAPQINPYGIIICRDGTVSELCSIQTQNQTGSVW